MNRRQIQIAAPSIGEGVWLALREPLQRNRLRGVV